MPSTMSILSILALALAAQAGPLKRASFTLQNGLDAQALNAQFQTLTASSSCNPGQNACIQGAFAQCVNGQFVTFPCAGGLTCVALPLVNSAGTSITCDTEADAETRIAATGASGGIAGRSLESRASFTLQNGIDAQQLNAQFASLTASSPCTPGQNACVGGQFAQCVNGQFISTPCAGGLTCVALPLVNSPGTSITCDTEADAATRIAATGATGASVQRVSRLFIHDSGHATYARNEIASYNTNLQAERGLPQDLVDWLAPTLQVSTFLTRERRAPDIVAVGFQELLPLHLGLSGLSGHVIENRNALILSQIEEHAPNKEKYTLIAKVVNVGVALLIYGRDDGVGRVVQDVQTQWTGCGPAYMGNKGAVGVRFRVPAADGGVGEVFTFVCAHLTAHAHNCPHRIRDFHYIVGSLLFPPLPGTESYLPTTMYSTSHLFFFGDLNFRINYPPDHPLANKRASSEVARMLDDESVREALKEDDQLYIERDQKGSGFVGMREGEFWKFKCSYKYQLEEVDKYDFKRFPAWTDRIMYTTYSDSPDTPTASNITNALYISIPSYTTSDHKPIVSLLLLPPSIPNTAPTPPVLKLPPTYRPQIDPYATLKRYLGRTLDRLIGYCWWLLYALGAGSAIYGIGNFILGLGLGLWGVGVEAEPAPGDTACDGLILHLI
ncbi:hypothetical protein NM688_g8125 [Phlebia brevispora]|uniref:Uncharacterized protein n=1 Tax=Phlebia brevispora TaxID=194682 RepID=A0ACC1RWZ1_9APHY|nr:hypothetical protein NM688_g8125 [Phlebia brevispora]